MVSDVTYSLNADDQIIAVNDAWTTFALANDGAALAAPGILGRSMWEFIADPTTVLVYERLFERVRSGVGGIRFQFRCDAPAIRRFMVMSISGGEDDRLDFVVRTLRVEPRPTLTFLDAHAKRSDVIVRMCAWCKRIPDARGDWIEIEAALPQAGFFDGAVVPLISHGMCEDCYRAACRMIEAANLETRTSK